MPRLRINTTENAAVRLRIPRQADSGDTLFTLRCYFPGSSNITGRDPRALFKGVFRRRLPLRPRRQLFHRSDRGCTVPEESFCNTRILFLHAFLASGEAGLKSSPQESADPLVFIVLVNWNGCTVTLECLESLAHIDYSAFRVLVVDNGSSDGSVDAIRTAYPEVMLLSLPDNRRFAGGNNEGIQYALNEGAELLLLLNNDTSVAPDFLRFLVDRLRCTECCGMVTPKIYYANPSELIWYAGGEISYWTGTMRHIGIREIDRGQHDTVRDVDYATGCCILTTAEIIRAVGGLDESYFMYTEDADWSVRIRKAGYRLVFEPRARVWHKVSVSAGGHLSSFKLWNKFKSNFRFFARHASWYHWLTFPWLSHLMNLNAALRYMITKRAA